MKRHKLWLRLHPCLNKNLNYYRTEIETLGRVPALNSFPLDTKAHLIFEKSALFVRAEQRMGS